MTHHFPIPLLQMLGSAVFRHVDAEVFKVFDHLIQSFIRVAFKVFEIHKNALFFCLNYIHSNCKNLLFPYSYSSANTPYRTKNESSITRPPQDCQRARSKSSKCVCASTPCKNCSHSQAETIFLLCRPLSDRCLLRAYCPPLTCMSRTANTHDLCRTSDPDLTSACLSLLLSVQDYTCQTEEDTIP